MKTARGENYHDYVRSKTLPRFYLGVLFRILLYIKYSTIAKVAKLKGAKIGKDSIIPLRLALRANPNLAVGESSIVEAFDIDLRSKVEIGSNVIIGKGVSILTASHDVDSDYFPTVSSEVVIADFCWISTRVLVLPRVEKIGFGSVVGAGSVLSIKNVPAMMIVAGSPARLIRSRKMVHSELVIGSMKGGDLSLFWSSKSNQ